MIELIEKLPRDAAVDASDTLTLPFELRQKSRQRVRLDSGREAAVLLPRGNGLDRGDRLVAADGTCVRIEAAAEDVSTGRTADPLLLARGCYHLGNRHVPLQVGPGFVRYQPDHVLDDMLRRLGLEVAHERAAFEPEPGAYAGHAHAGDEPRHDHAHAGDDPSHGHAHEHDEPSHGHAHEHDEPSHGHAHEHDEPRHGHAHEHDEPSDGHAHAHDEPRHVHRRAAASGPAAGEGRT